MRAQCKGSPYVHEFYHIQLLHVSPWYDQKHSLGEGCNTEPLLHFIPSTEPCAQIFDT